MLIKEPSKTKKRSTKMAFCQMVALFNYIDRSLNDNCLTFDEVSDFAFLKFGKDVLKDTLHHVIHREFGNDFKTVIGIPLDSKRVDVEPEKIDQYFIDLEQEVQKTHPYFIFNLDEVVVIRRPNDIMLLLSIVGSSYDKPTVYYSVERTEKRITALFCISTNVD